MMHGQKNIKKSRNVCLSVRPSALMEKLGSHLTDSHEN